MSRGAQSFLGRLFARASPVVHAWCLCTWVHTPSNFRRLFEGMRGTSFEVLEEMPSVRALGEEAGPGADPVN